MTRTFAILLILIVGTSSLAGDKSAKTPNVVVDISAALINAAVKRSVDSIEPIDEVIQESPAKGTGRTVGIVTAELIPDSRKAVVDIVFRGQVDAETTTTRTFVLINASSVTQLQVHRRVIIDGNGIQSIPGANFGRAAISLREIKGRREPEGLAVKLATDAFRRNRGDAELESATKSAWNTSRRMGTELAPALIATSKAALQTGGAFKKAGLAVQGMEFSTTSSGLQARLRLDTPGREIGPMPAASKGVDLGVRVHQSVINEAAQKNYAGKSVSLLEIQKFYDELTQGMLRDDRKNADQQAGRKALASLLALPGPPAIVNFAQKDPLTIALSENTLTFVVDIASIRQDKKVYEGMRVRAEYKLDNDKDGLHAVRKGAVKFLPPLEADKKLEAQPFHFAIVRELVFAELFKERLLAPAPHLHEALANVKLQTPRGGARDGWFAVAWTLAE